MTSSALGAAVLVVSEREDRKRLFDLCDAMGYGPIYSARDFTQAQTLLEQDVSVSLAVVEFAQRPTSASAFCERLGDDAHRRGIVLLGITGGAVPEGFNPYDAAAVHDWIRSPVDRREVSFRLRQILSRSNQRGDSRSGQASIDQLPLPAFQFGVDDRIVRGNLHLADRIGLGSAQLNGQHRDAVIDLDPRQGESVGWLKPRHGAPQKVRVFQSLHDRICTVLLLDSEPVSLARLWLEQIESSFGYALDDAHAANQWADHLCQQLGLQLFAVIAERTGGDLEPRVLAMNSAGGNDASVDALWEQPLYREVLSGQRLQLLEQASKVRTDPTVRRMKLDWLIGVPLKGEGLRPVGAVLAGGQGTVLDVAALEQALHVLSGRFGLEWQAHQHRLDSRYQGLHDHLTKLPNRLLFNDRLNSAIAEAQRSGELFAVMFVDLDRFKNINDSLGHSIGDQVLAGVSKRMKASVRASDTVARYAGDEFTVVLRHIVHREDVMRIADKLVRVLETPLNLVDGSELQVTASIGIAFFPDDGTTAEKLLKNADTAMYSAKGLGRNNVQTYVAMAEDSHQQRLALEAKLRVAERNRELRAYYQPKVDTRSEDLVGMEALIRWEHPELGLISPGFFIPLAEETGLIVPIGEWVMRTACVDCKRLSDKFNLQLKVSVNLSALQLKQPGLPALVAAILKETNLPPIQLDLEVTESMNVREIPGLLDTLQKLRDLGCSISIDDFGTGQSSLDYLKRFPCDAIKVDQTFVRNIGIDPDDEAIIRATIKMAHDMGLNVIAEGVETEDHLRFLREEKCEELQGFLFARPLPALTFENLLADREQLLRSA